MGKLVNIPVGKPANENETAPRRAYSARAEAITKVPGYKAATVFELMNEAVASFGPNHAMAWRDLIDIHEEKKHIKKIVDGKETTITKNWYYFEKTGYKYITYDQLSKLVVDYGKGLVELGIKPANEERLHIYAGTSQKWLQTFLAATSQSIPIVTAYDTLGESGLTHSIRETRSVAVFTDNSLIHTLINPLKEIDHIRYVIYSEPIDENDTRCGGKFYREAKDAVDQIKEIRPDIKFYSYDEVIELGKQSKLEPTHPKAENTACIMYTSGSTGTPKGVVLTHANIVAGVAGICPIIPRSYITSGDKLLAFLPLAHIFELTFELVNFYWGGTLGYGNPKTLSDVSMRNCKGDIKEFGPSIMVGVAAVFEMIKKGIMGQIAKKPPMLQKAFWAAYKTKVAATRYSIPVIGSVIDNTIFKQIKENTGGKLKLMLNGGSALSEETQLFISTTICPLLIGYGLTETNANTTVMSPATFEIGVAGTLTSAVTCKLKSFEEGGYYAKNNQGEVCLRGAPITSHYYHNEEETKNAFDEDGWFCTGDIGEWTKTGQLKVIDRKKNLIKTSNGEYIALEKIESIYRSNPYVGNICCYADETRVKPIAIIFPHEANIQKLAGDLNLPEEERELEHLCDNEEIHKAITKSLIETGKKQKLQGIELIQGVALTSVEWTPQNGFVTSAQKLQRKKILAANRDQVEEVYARG